MLTEGQNASLTYVPHSKFLFTDCIRQKVCVILSFAEHHPPQQRWDDLRLVTGFVLLLVQITGAIKFEDICSPMITSGRSTGSASVGCVAVKVTQGDLHLTISLKKCLMWLDPPERAPAAAVSPKRGTGCFSPFHKANLA